VRAWRLLPAKLDRPSFLLCRSRATASGHQPNLAPAFPKDAERLCLVLLGFDIEGEFLSSRLDLCRAVSPRAMLSREFNEGPPRRSRSSVTRKPHIAAICAGTRSPSCRIRYPSCHWLHSISSAARHEGSATAGSLAGGSHGWLLIAAAFAFECVTALLQRSCR
jgi:hypothetical protein